MNEYTLKNVEELRDWAREFAHTLTAPVVVALNKADINEKKHTIIDTVKLSEILKCPVVNTISSNKKGLRSLIDKAVEVVKKGNDR